MKRILIVFLLIVVFSVGCSGGVDVTEKPDISENPEIEEGEFSDNFIAAEYLTILMEPYLSRKYYDLGSWQEYILDKYGIEIYLSYGFYRGKPHGFDPNSISLLNYSFFQSSIWGDPTNVLKYSDPKMMYDLTPYYDKYGWGNNIDSRLLEYLTVQDKIYAVPTVPDRYVIPRYYNEKYLKDLGMDVPVTLTEFQQYLRGAKGLNDSEAFYPMCTRSWHCVPVTSDIFRAFGVYTGTENNNMFSYEPNSGSYEDAVFSDNFEMALSYIRELQNENLFGIVGVSRNFMNPTDYTNYFISDITKIDKEFATEYMYRYDSDKNAFLYNPSKSPLYEYEQGYFLTHTNSTNVCELRSDIAFYMFPLQIDNIHGTVDLFNMVMTDPQFRPDLTYGMEGDNYILANGEVVPVEPAHGGWVNIRQIKTNTSDSLSLIPESTEYISDIKSELIYELDVFTQFKTHYSGLSYNATQSKVEELFYPFISVKDAMDNYKEDMKKWGGPDRVEEINERCGTVPSYDYGN